MSIHKLLMHRPLMLNTKRCARMAATPFTNKSANSQINKGIIPIHGILTKRAGLLDDFWLTTNYDVIQKQIEEALADDTVEHIILDIDSPGGETSGLFDLADFIYEARSYKPIIAYANDEAYSAAYALASCAHQVVMNRTSGVGSIGVVATHVDQSAYDAKQGLTYTTVFAGNRKNDLSPHEPISTEAYCDLQAEVDRLYDMFVDLVARNRGLTTQAVRDTQAGVYFAEQAIVHKLADSLSTNNQYIQHHVTHFPKQGTTQMTTELITPTPPTIDSDRTDLLSMIQLCRLANMPEQLGHCIEHNMNPEATSQYLMKLLAERTGPEVSAVLPLPTHKNHQAENANVMLDAIRHHLQKGPRS